MLPFESGLINHDAGENAGVMVTRCFGAKRGLTSMGEPSQAPCTYALTSISEFLKIKGPKIDLKQ